MGRGVTEMLKIEKHRLNIHKKLLLEFDKVVDR